MNDLRDFIAGMPKCELHVHIEGTLEPEMKFELARSGMASRSPTRTRPRCGRPMISTTCPLFSRSITRA